MDMEWLEQGLQAVNTWVWGPPLLILLVGTGICLTIKLGLLQIIRLPLAIKLVFGAKSEGEGDFGVKAIMPYRILFLLLIAVGAFLKLDVIWILSDIVNGLMVLLNLIALLLLSGVIGVETKRYLDHLKESRAWISA